MKIQLLKPFEVNNLFCSAQKASERVYTTTAVMKLAEKILEVYEQGKSLSLTLCDLNKAFDVVSHDLLLTKLERCGVEVRSWKHRVLFAG